MQEAARLLETSVEGVRSRIKRGTLVKEKGEDGTVYVLLDLDHTSPGGAETSPGGDQASDRTTDRAAIEARTNELIAELRAQNEHLRSELSMRNEELRRKDTIIMTMAQRIPELEPAQEPRDASDMDTEASSKVEGSGDPQKPSERHRSWLVRFFFGP